MKNTLVLEMPFFEVPFFKTKINFWVTILVELNMVINFGIDYSHYLKL